MEGNSITLPSMFAPNKQQLCSGSPRWVFQQNLVNLVEVGDAATEFVSFIMRSGPTKPGEMLFVSG